jgi:hypothetical protein
MYIWSMPCICICYMLYAPAVHLCIHKSTKPSSTTKLRYEWRVYVCMYVLIVHVIKQLCIHINGRMQMNMAYMSLSIIIFLYRCSVCMYVCVYADKHDSDSDWDWDWDSDSFVTNRSLHMGFYMGFVVNMNEKILSQVVRWPNMMGTCSV